MTTDLKESLRKLPQAVSAVIGVRAAMRALPVLALGRERLPAFAYWSGEVRSSRLLSIFRAYQTATAFSAVAAGSFFGAADVAATASDAVAVSSDAPSSAVALFAAYAASA